MGELGRIGRCRPTSDSPCCDSRGWDALLVEGVDGAVLYTDGAGIPGIGARCSLYCGGSSTTSSPAGTGSASSKSVCRMKRVGRFDEVPAMADFCLAAEDVTTLCPLSESEDPVVNDIPVAAPGIEGGVVCDE